MKPFARALVLAGCAVACAPRLDGQCASDSQCADDELCAAGGFCVARVGSARVDTPDDSSGAGWYRGAKASPPTASIEISAILPPAYRARSWAYYKDTTATYDGREAGGRWHFTLPRANAPSEIIIESSDAAGVLAPQTTLSIQFDSITDFAPAIGNDPTWYGGGEDVPVRIGFPVLPESGLASVTVSAGTTYRAATPGADARQWTASLPGSLAPQDREGPVSFTVTATSITGFRASATSVRFFDTKPPVVDAVVPLYPAAPATPSAWGTDGAHFARTHAGPLVRVLVHDCGAGFSSKASVDTSVLPGLHIDAIADTGTTFACAPPSPVAPISAVTLSGDLNATPVGIDTTIGLAATFADDAFAGSGAEPHPNWTAPQTFPIAITRRLWQAGVTGATSLALGPPGNVVAAGSKGLWLARPDAAPVLRASTPIGAVPVVVPNAGDARIFAFTNGALRVLPLASGPELGSCALPSDEIDPQGLLLVDASSAIATSVHTEQKQVCAQSCDPGLCGIHCCQICDTVDVSVVKSGVLSVAGACTTPKAHVPARSAAFGRSRRMFGATGTTLVEVDPIDGTGTSTTLPGANAVIVTDAGGADAVLALSATSACRSDFVTGFATPASFGDLAAPVISVALPPGHALLGVSATTAGTLQQVDLGGTRSRGIAAGFSGAPLIAVDAARPAATAYVARAGDPATVTTYSVDAVDGLAPGPLPAFTAPARIDDLALGADGVLYVLAGGTVSALQTDSPGLGTGDDGANAFAWPIARRDACRSANLAFHCPF